MTSSQPMVGEGAKLLDARTGRGIGGGLRTSVVFGVKMGMHGCSHGLKYTVEGRVCLVVRLRFIRGFE